MGLYRVKPGESSLLLLYGEAGLKNERGVALEEHLLHPDLLASVVEYTSIY
jgi:hypothetical protein